MPDTPIVACSITPSGVYNGPPVAANHTPALAIPTETVERVRKALRSTAWGSDDTDSRIVAREALALLGANT